MSDMPLFVGAGGGGTVDVGRSVVELDINVDGAVDGDAVVVSGAFVVEDVAVVVGTAVDVVGATVVVGSAAPGTNIEQLRTT
jgi:hypothetical protein